MPKKPSTASTADEATADEATVNEATVNETATTNAPAERRLPLTEWAAREGVSATLVRALQVRHNPAARFTAKEWQIRLDSLKKVKV